MLNTKLILAFAVCVAAVAAINPADPNCQTQSKYCQNGGICHDGSNGFAQPGCECSSPYMGDACDFKLRECSDNPCGNGGTCIPGPCQPVAVGNGVGQNAECFRCVCKAGWGGSKFYTDGAQFGANVWNPGGLCDTPLPHNDCTTGQKCSNGGTCTSVNTPTVSSFTCACASGWQTSNAVGWNCTVPIFNCKPGEVQGFVPCLNGGTCPASPNQNCQCPPGFSGSDCSTQPVCEDTARPCQNGGTCNSANGRCACPSMYVGSTNSAAARAADPYCTVLKTCEQATPYCKNGATCTDAGTPNGITASCACTSGWAGPTCNVTTFCSTNPCANGATCMDTGNGAGHCINCPDKVGGQKCDTPIKGCAASTCANGGSCGCYDWGSCNANGYGSQSICSCSGDPGLNTVGVYADCGCNTTVVSKCPAKNVQTRPNANSGAAPASYDPVCSWAGSCSEHADASYCTCAPNFWGDKCENYDNPCLNYPCQNGGRCRTVGDTTPYGRAYNDRYWGYACTCKYPFYGTNCELTFDPNAKEVDICADNQCQNGATCQMRQYSLGGGLFFDPTPAGNTDPTSSSASGNSWAAPNYQCACAPGYSGNYCEVRKRSCAENPCATGSYCTDSTNDAGYSCDCPCGMAGTNCEVTAVNSNTANVWNGIGADNLLDFCSQDDVCQNGGSCFNSLNRQGFQCMCTPGHQGNRCQFPAHSAAASVVPSALIAAVAAVVAFALNH